MTSDLASQIGAIQREVRTAEQDGERVRTVVATQTYDADIDDVWDAITSAERIPRWFLPVTGELRLGGHYQFEGNAGGDILECEPPERLRVTWGMHGDVSWVKVRLVAAGDDRTTLRLEHTARVPDEFWTEYGPGAVGVGWDLSLLGLRQHFAAPDVTVNAAEMEAWLLSDDGRVVAAESSAAWADASIADGTDEAAARSAADRTTAFYTTVPAAPDDSA